jgi:two-component system LytT family response regulator
MNELEAALNPEQFVRIHRSTIVNLDRIKEMYPHFNGDYLVRLHDGTELKLSRSRKEWLEQWLGRGAR